MWDLIVSVPDHCLSFYFSVLVFLKQCSERNVTENNVLAKRHLNWM